ncbi:hypothetical protein F5B21DRAFT_471462, partial [Xylaria acuta]
QFYLLCSWVLPICRSLDREGKALGNRLPFQLHGLAFIAVKPKGVKTEYGQCHSSVKTVSLGLHHVYEGLV